MREKARKKGERDISVCERVSRGSCACAPVVCARFYFLILFLPRALSCPEEGLRRAVCECVCVERACVCARNSSVCVVLYGVVFLHERCAAAAAAAIIIIFCSTQGARFNRVLCCAVLYCSNRKLSLTSQDGHERRRTFPSVRGVSELFQ